MCNTPVPAHQRSATGPCCHLSRCYRVLLISIPPLQSCCPSDQLTASFVERYQGQLTAVWKPCSHSFCEHRERRCSHPEVCFGPTCSPTSKSFAAPFDPILGVLLRSKSKALLSMAINARICVAVDNCPADWSTQLSLS